MGKMVLAVFVSFVVVMSTPRSYGSFESSKDISEWLHKISYSKEKVTHLRFYFHDIVSGSNPTALTIAQSKITNTSQTGYGIVNMMDDPLTEGLEPTSKVVGRAQGLYGSTSMEDVRLLMAFNLVFITGKFNGSTLSVLANNPVFQSPRELPIVGGTGVFRLARGFVLAKTYQFNMTSGDAIVKYNVAAIHY